MKKEIPILYSTPMVKAKLAGRKTMTRRIMKPQPTPDDIEKIKDWSDVIFPCPYGQPGDLHWVRENWQLTGWFYDDGEMVVSYQAGGAFTCPFPEIGDGNDWINKNIEQLVDGGYFAPETDDESPLAPTDKKQPWKPSIHMPKTAARIWEEVVSVRVERLQVIGEADAIAEGVVCSNHLRTGQIIYKSYDKRNDFEYSAKESFQSLWFSINGEESWNANPFVWVVETKNISLTGKP